MKQLFLIGLSLIIAFFYVNNTQAQFGLKFEIGIGLNVDTTAIYNYRHIDYSPLINKINCGVSLTDYLRSSGFQQKVRLQYQLGFPSKALFNDHLNTFNGRITSQYYNHDFDELEKISKYHQLNFNYSLTYFIKISKIKIGPQIGVGFFYHFSPSYSGLRDNDDFKFKSNHINHPFGLVNINFLAPNVLNNRADLTFSMGTQVIKEFNTRSNFKPWIFWPQVNAGVLINLTKDQ